MKKFVCPVCGYVYEGDNPPEKCPQCGVPGSKFKEVEESSRSWAAEHVVGVAQGVSQDIIDNADDVINLFKTLEKLEKEKNNEYRNK